MDIEEMQNICFWDILVLDEGHRAKNVKTQLSTSLKSFEIRKQKIILTGTPVQNNLEEFYAIFDLIKSGVFGTFSRFKQQFSNPVKVGLQKNATKYERELAFKLLIKLKELYGPYFIRREKNQIFKMVSAEVIKRPLMTDELPLKTDLVIWMPLSNLQKEIYSLIVANQQSMINRQGTVD